MDGDSWFKNMHWSLEELCCVTHANRNRLLCECDGHVRHWTCLAPFSTSAASGCLFGMHSANSPTETQMASPRQQGWNLPESSLQREPVAAQVVEQAAVSRTARLSAQGLMILGTSSKVGLDSIHVVEQCYCASAWDSHLALCSGT